MCREDLLPSAAGKHYQRTVCGRCGQKHVEQSRDFRDLSRFNTDDISKGCLHDDEEVESHPYGDYVMDEEVEPHLYVDYVMDISSVSRNYSVNTSP